MSNISPQKNARTPEQNISLRNLCNNFWLEETAILDMQMSKLPMISGYGVLKMVVTECSVLKMVVTECSVLKMVVTECSVLKMVVTECSALKMVVTECSALQMVVTECNANGKNRM